MKYAWANKLCALKCDKYDINLWWINEHGDAID